MDPLPTKLDRDDGWEHLKSVGFDSRLLHPVGWSSKLPLGVV